MSNVLNEIQQLRLSLVKETKFDLDKAEKAYNFIVGEQPKVIANPVINESKPDGIYFILSPSNAIHESLATDEEKHNSIAVGVKMGNRFANVVLYDSANGDEIALYQEDEVSCDEQLFNNTFWKARSDWNGEANTNNMRNALNPDLNLDADEYIPSVAQLHLILLNINEINNALEEVGGEPMKANWYWSSTEYSNTSAWYVHFGSGSTNSYYKAGSFVVRPSVVCEI